MEKEEEKIVEDTTKIEEEVPHVEEQIEEEAEIKDQEGAESTETASEDGSLGEQHEGTSGENEVGEERVEEQTEEPQEKMLTQSQVNELVGRARQEGRESVMKELYARYGVSGDEELNGVFGRGQAYDILNDDFDIQSRDLEDVRAENALLKSNIDPSRWEDVRLILSGRGEKISPESIEAMIPTHPEWRKVMAAEATQTTAQPLSPESMEAMSKNVGSEKPVEAPGKLKQLGTEISEEPVLDEEAKVRKMFSIN